MKLNIPVIPYIKSSKLKDGDIHQTWEKGAMLWSHIEPIHKNTLPFDDVDPVKGKMARNFYTVRLRKSPSCRHISQIRRLLQADRTLDIISPWQESKRGYVETIAVEIVDPTVIN